MLVDAGLTLYEFLESYTNEEQAEEQTASRVGPPVSVVRMASRFDMPSTLIRLVSNMKVRRALWAACFCPATDQPTAGTGAGGVF